MGMELLKTFVALVAVLGLMGALMVAVKKYFRVGTGRGGEIVDIEVLSQKTLQPKRQLYVVKVLNKVLVLGSTENGIQALGEIDDDAVIRSVEERQEEKKLRSVSTRSSFRQKLHQAETLGDFFHRPFNIVLWRGDKPGVGSAFGMGSESHR